MRSSDADESDIDEPTGGRSYYNKGDSYVSPPAYQSYDATYGPSNGGGYGSYDSKSGYENNGGYGMDAFFSISKI